MEPSGSNIPNPITPRLGWTLREISPEASTRSRNPSPTVMSGLSNKTNHPKNPRHLYLPLWRNLDCARIESGEGWGLFSVFPQGGFGGSIVHHHNFHLTRLESIGFGQISNQFFGGGPLPVIDNNHPKDITKQRNSGLPPSAFGEPARRLFRFIAGDSFLGSPWLPDLQNAVAFSLARRLVGVAFRCANPAITIFAFFGLASSRLIAAWL